jgi:Mn2+/Fe2+ NRAMP family transporter
MWFWKKWGIYLYGIAAVAGAAVALLASGDLFLIFGALLPAIIVLYIVLMQRNNFE